MNPSKLEALITESESAYKGIALIHLMRNDPTLSRIEYEEELAKATNRLTYDFVNNFCKADFSIDWEKLLRFNSGKDKVPWISKLVPVISTGDQDDSCDDRDEVDSDEEALDE